jgi:hypothetical protein
MRYRLRTLLIVLAIGQRAVSRIEHFPTPEAAKLCKESASILA